jgi:hypothetical protein
MMKKKSKKLLGVKKAPWYQAVILKVLKHTTKKPDQVVEIAHEAEVDIKEDLSMDVSSKPRLTMLDRYSKIIKSVDDQTRQLKLSSSQKTFMRG